MEVEREVRWHKSVWQCGKAFDAGGQRAPEAERWAKGLMRSREKRKEKKAVYHVLGLLALYEHFGGLIYIFEFSVLTVWA
jgi:hypothetical protein